MASLFFIKIFHCSIHEQLLGVESGPRWSRDGDDLKKYLQINEDRARLAILQELHSLTVDRWFLLHLKRRYAGEHDFLFVVVVTPDLLLNNYLQLQLLNVPYNHVHHHFLWHQT